MLIDDNERVRAKIARLLSMSSGKSGGYAVEEHDFSEEGLAPGSIQFAAYDLLVVSYQLSNVDWVEWLNLNSKKTYFPPLLFLCLDVDRAQKKLAEYDSVSFLDMAKLTRYNFVKKVDKLIKGAEIAAKEVLSISSSVEKAVADEDVADTSEADEVSLEGLARPDLSGYQVVKGSEPRVARKASSNRRKNKAKAAKKSRIACPKIPGFTVHKKIGQGGMSSIYGGTRDSDGIKVAIKVLSPALSKNKKQIARSDQEFKLISRINNKHIVKLYMQGVYDGVMVTVMEHFDSGDLKERMAKGITQTQALKFIRQICDGLAAIHGSGIIHRDLKPANIMFREDETLAIIDFGISKDINTKLELTSPGQIIGTPNYMAPEQGTASYKPDSRCDIYSVGVMIYEMLTGKKPFQAASAAAVIEMHLNDPIPKLPNHFFEMQGLLDTCMAKFPHQRFQSAIDMIEYIEKEFRWDVTLDFEY